MNTLHECKHCRRSWRALPLAMGHSCARPLAPLTEHDFRAVFANDVSGGIRAPAAPAAAPSAVPQEAPDGIPGRRYGDVLGAAAQAGILSLALDFAPGGGEFGGGGASGEW